MLLQSATGITKCDNFITKCDDYYKVRQYNALDMLATQAYQTILDCGLMYHRHPKLVKRAFFKKSVHLVMLGNEAIYTVIYRNRKNFEKKFLIS